MMTQAARTVTGKHFAVGVFVLLALATVLPPCVLRMMVFTVFTGTIPLLLFRARWGAVTLLLLSLPLGLVFWSGLTLTVGALAGPSGYVFSPWLMVLLLSVLTWYVKYKSAVGQTIFARVRLRPVASEWLAVFFTFCAAIPLGYLASKNGNSVTVSGMHVIRLQQWIFDDAFYMCALAEQILARGGWPVENPFMAGVGNYYPSFFHCGLAGIFDTSGETVVGALCHWMAFFGSMSIGLAALVCARLSGGIRRPVGVLVGALALAIFLVHRADLVLFPQTTFTVMPVLMLVAWLLFDLNGRRGSLRALTVAVVISVGMILGHTISSVIAIGLLSTVCAMMFLRRADRRNSLILAGVLALMCALVLAINHFPYAGMSGYAQLRQFNLEKCLLLYQMPSVIPLLAFVGIICLARGNARLRFGVLFLLLFTVGALYTISGVRASDDHLRWFTLFNAPRLWQFALLLVYPVAGWCLGRRRDVALVILVSGFVGSLIYPFPLNRITEDNFSAKTMFMEDATRSEGVLSFLRTKAEPTDVVSSNLCHGIGALTGLPEMMPDEENSWGMDTLPPAAFMWMKEEFRRMWLADEDPNVTPTDRMNIVASTRVRWLVNAGAPTVEDKRLESLILARFPEGTVTHVMTVNKLALFRVNLELIDSMTTAPANE